MKRALSPTDFNSSRLIRFLADVAVLEPAEPKQDFAERLGQWLGVSDAITLHAAQLAPKALPDTAPTGPIRGQSAARTRIEADFARTRTLLVSAIKSSFSPENGEARIKLPLPKPGAAAETAAAYEPYLRFYLAHQGEMESGIRPLRARVRKALAKSSAELAPLAALDAAFDTILAARERQLLSTVPLLLERRFEQLFEAHRQGLDDAQQTDDAERWMQPGQWLACFCKELEGALLAELDLRLQPTFGLIETISNKVNTH